VNEFEGELREARSLRAAYAAKTDEASLDAAARVYLSGQVARLDRFVAEAERLARQAASANVSAQPEKAAA
jgi:hypothetical protein